MARFTVHTYSGNMERHFVASWGNIVAECETREDAETIAETLKTQTRTYDRYTLVSFAGSWHMLDRGQYSRHLGSNETNALAEVAYYNRNASSREDVVRVLPFAATGAYGIDAHPADFFTGEHMTPSQYSACMARGYIVPMLDNVQYDMRTSTYHYGIFDADIYGYVRRQLIGDNLPVIDDKMQQAIRAELHDNWVAYLLECRAVNAAHVTLENGQIVYLTFAKLASMIARGETWERGTITRHHVRAKVGKGLRSILPVSWVANTDIESMVNAIRAYDPDTIADRIAIISGEDIVSAYDENGYAERQDIGQLATSCMRYEECADYLRIYADNPDRVSLVTLRDEYGRLTARALLWKQDNDTTYLDRVYGNDATRSAFAVWAENHGHDANADSVTLRNAHHDMYPYMDTFRYLTITSDGSGVLSPHDYGQPNYGLYGTSGDDYSVIRPAENRCERCGEAGDDVSQVETNRYGETAWYCLDCAQDYVCQSCGEWTYGSGSYCDDCSPTCAACGEESEDRDDNGLCTDCAERYTCAHCGESTYGTYHTLQGMHRACWRDRAASVWGARFADALADEYRASVRGSYDARVAVNNRVWAGERVLPVVEYVPFADGTTL